MFPIVFDFIFLFLPRLQTAPSGYYRNTIDCVKKTIQGEGPYGFYRGVYSPLYGQMFFRACSFGTFYPVVSFLNNRAGTNTLAYNQLFLAGGFTGFVIAFVEVS
jgi:solute carrier family 25 carnitine/acylcarnitine transporter 20/29